MHIILHAIFLLAAWKWGDWKHWKKYYSTILYLIIIDLLFNFIYYNHPLWKFNPVSFDRFIYSNHTLITLGIDFINFPAIVLLYLGNYPEGKIKQTLYILAWVLLNSTIEVLSLAIIKGISHYNGWNIWFSVLVNVFYYVMLRVHYVRPLAAWLISFGMIAVFCTFFGLPLNKMK